MMCDAAPLNADIAAGLLEVLLVVDCFAIGVTPLSASRLPPKAVPRMRITIRVLRPSGACACRDGKERLGTTPQRANRHNHAVRIFANSFAVVPTQKDHGTGHLRQPIFESPPNVATQPRALKGIAAGLNAKFIGTGRSEGGEFDRPRIARSAAKSLPRNSGPRHGTNLRKNVRPRPTPPPKPRYSYATISCMRVKRVP